ncbi:MAG: flagellar brake protein [Bacteroidales bacterium]|nr:flagellar brake protein [Lachnoclostridium sp.]MCM1385026.1 flagellar brake protein [Lachnoclostridium sp.]MCM1465342.1 flagellar brake protein [Bacteroidales bacterium]
MLSKLIEEGNRVELSAVDTELNMNPQENQKIYYSKVYNILSEDTMEIYMPMEQTKLILLPVDGEYNMVLYTEEHGLFQSFVRIIDRYKSNNVYILVVELTSNLRKYQRREYYRFSCALEMCSRNLEEDEVQAIEQKSPYILQPTLPLKRSVIVDISGGGLRFMSTQRYEPGSLIYCSYYLARGKESKQYEVVGKVLDVKELEHRPGTFEHRVQYYDLDVKTREEIIKFIFEEERKERRKDLN